MVAPDVEIDDGKGQFSSSHTLLFQQDKKLQSRAVFSGLDFKLDSLVL